MQKHHELVRYFLLFGVSVVCTLSGFLIGRYTTSKQMIVNTVVVTPTPAPEVELPEPTNTGPAAVIQYKNRPDPETPSQ